MLTDLQHSYTVIFLSTFCTYIL